MNRRAAAVGDTAELRDVLTSMGLASPRPVVVVVGGAGQTERRDMELMAPLVRDGLIPVAQELEACVVDGGTDAGIMQVIGRERAVARASFPLIGVVAGALARPDARDPSVPLEPNHSHVLMVPGTQWGDEAPWLSRVAATLSEGSTSVTVLAGGGVVAVTDVSESIAAGRPVVVLTDSGRLARRLGEDVERARELVGSRVDGLVAIAGDDAPWRLASLLRRMLTRREQ